MLDRPRLNLRDDAVLFLDVDGVLNNRRVFLDRRFAPFPLDGLCVQRMKGVVRETQCRVVLSSAWREMPMLEGKLAGDLVFIDHDDWDQISTRHADRSTKRLNGKRGEEIAEWLSRHPEVTQFAIVDDEADMLPEQLPFFVQTDFEHGLTKRGAARLGRILASPQPLQDDADASVSVMKDAGPPDNAGAPAPRSAFDRDGEVNRG